MTDVAKEFMKILAGEPLSLALCAMNLLLLYFLFKQGAEFVKQRGEAMQIIVTWQEATQILLANCVSKDVMEIIIAALEKDRDVALRVLDNVAKTDID